MTEDYPRYPDIHSLEVAQQDLNMIMVGMDCACVNFATVFVQNIALTCLNLFWRYNKWKLSQQLVIIAV